MIKAGIIGATGYAGGELVRLLLQHKEVEIKWYGSRSYIDQKYASVYGNMFQLVEDTCLDDNMEELAKQVDVIFTATPQGFCASVINDSILNRTKIIDLSADFRIKDVSVYEKWYGITHKAPQYIKEAVYGLCGLDRGVPEVWGSVYDVRDLLDSSVKLMDGKSPLEISLPGPLNAVKKALIKGVKGTVIEDLLREHNILKEGM